MPGEDAFIDRFVVPLPPEPAFSIFVDEASVWWPHNCTLSEEEFDRLAIDATPGGRVVEFDHHGNMYLWGRVLEVERPTRIALSWHITTDWGLQASASDASRLRIKFEAQGGRSVVTFVHQSLKNQGDWEAHLAALSAPDGWPCVLERFRATCAERAKVAVS